MSKRNTLDSKKLRREEREARKAAFRAHYETSKPRLVEFDLPTEPPRVSDLVIAESVLWTPDQEEQREGGTLE